MTGPVLLYDGDCALCAESVRFVLRHERRHTLCFAPLDGAFGRALFDAHPELAHADSLIWYDPMRAAGDDHILTHSSAVLRVARYLGGVWHLARVLLALPRPLRDAGYRFVAAHRHRVIRGGSACLVPTPGTAARFLA